MTGRNVIVGALALVPLLLVLASGTSVAAPPAGLPYDLGPVEALTDIFVNAAAGWEDALRDVALGLFRGLVIVEIVWTVGFALLAGADLLGVLAVLLRQLLVIGFFFWLLQGGATYPLEIINSFSSAAGLANAAVGGSVIARPEDVVSAGISLAAALWNGLSFRHPGLDVLLAISGVVVLCAMVGAAATLIEVIVEAALVAYAGIVLLGFGGTAFTREYTITYVRWAVSIGVKKMFVLLILGLGIGVMQQLSNYLGQQHSLIPVGEVGVAIAVPLLFWRIAEKLPYKAQELIAGTSQYHPLNVSDAIKQAATAAVAVAGGGAATAAAFKLASSQLSGSGGNGGGASGGSGGNAGPDSGPGGGGNTGSGPNGGGSPGYRSIAAQAFRNMGGSMASDVGMRLTGDHMTRLLNSGWRMGRAMNDEAEAIKGGNKK